MHVRFAFVGRVIEWRGPSPYYYVAVPADVSADILEVAASVSYGWGVIPVEARISEVAFTTSLFPKDGCYLLPLRVAVRKAHAIARRRRDGGDGDQAGVERRAAGRSADDDDPAPGAARWDRDRLQDTAGPTSASPWTWLCWR